MKRGLILGAPGAEQPSALFVRPAPSQLLGAWVRNTKSGHFGQVLYAHFLPNRVILECLGNCAPEHAPEAFEIVLVYQEVYGELYQLVLESPYLDWEWFDAGSPRDPFKVKPQWRVLINEE